MKRRQAGKLAVYALVLVLLFWPLSQLLELFHTKTGSGDATHLLYQVSLFQMELLGGYLYQSSESADTAGLDGLKQSLYSAGYTHERLQLAVGTERLAPLLSVNQLMQYVLRLQVGGNRPLRAEEKQALQEASAQFQDLYDVYEALMSSGSSIISSQNNKLIKQDEAIDEMIRKKLLQ
ncbi:hypothetical protein J2Z66_007587 [Paenibacillus eucommiae]|uniref:S-adenosylmethionine decarboxylase n=2 Tax=Paenibacillus eucommiae TaxID=1355755 RepID=A0ABS4J7X7_9BACL|nr:hypothetical protein [Paenibacillus eucommiae]